MTRLAGFDLFLCAALLAAAPASAWAAAGPQVDIVVVASDARQAAWIVPVAESDELEGPSPSERHDERELSDKDDGGLGDLDDRAYEGSDIDDDMARTEREARRNRSYMGEGGRVPRGRGRGRDLAY
jgi:hypothetical protein